MNLYHVTQSQNNDYDTYSDFVVACETEEEARHFYPSGHYKWHDNAWYFQYADGTERVAGICYDWTTPEYIQTKLLGVAAEGIEGIICTSFHAG
jgi:hypothetical protein